MPAISEYPIIFAGPTASLRTQPAKEVKGYPKLSSKQPLYGSITFDRGPGEPGPATMVYFVLDESGTENAGEKAAKPDAAKPAADNPPKSRYDRLYFNVDRNLDLTSDAAVSPIKDLPDGLARLLAGPQTTIVFNTVRIPLDEDPKAKGAVVSVLPMIVLYGKTYEGNAGRMVLMAASARKGELRLGKRAYSALLVPRNGMSGRMDHANTQLLLSPVDGRKPAPSDPGMNVLGAIRAADGEFYRLSATPSGDRLTVRALGGERGVFELSVGDKEIKPLGVAGILAWKDSMLPLGEIGERAATAKYRLPVGDYRPSLLMADCGNLRISLRDDYTLTTGTASKRAGSIEVRKNKPYVLDLATRPEVHFQAPCEGETFKPGDQIRLAAVLRFPHNGLLIGGLEDMSKKTGETKWTAEDGTQMTSPQYSSLVPTVVITDSSGKRSGRRDNALWLRGHLRVLVASTNGPETLRRRRDIYGNRHLRHEGPLRQARRNLRDQAKQTAGKEGLG